ncbi:MAG: amidohydrolase family protein [Thermoanaerobaculia bacterium]|nr:amidohydrolase family protein [Thermoanaerobaculia bacterium]
MRAQPPPSHALPWLLGALVVAFGVPLGAEAPRVHALTDVKIVVAPGQVIAKGTVVLRDGVIEAVGAAVTPPPDARIWKFENATVYPGLIDLYSPRPWPKDDPADAKAAHPNPLVRPERSLAPYVADDDKAGRYREAGFTTVLAVPADGLVRGRGALVNLGAGSAADNLLFERFTQTVALDTSAEDGYPNSLMGAIALARQTFLDAQWYQKAQEAYKRKPSQRRPPLDAALTALGPAALGKETVIFEAGDGGIDAILRAGGFAKELGLDAWIVGNGSEYQRLSLVEALGRPVVLPLNFPDTPTAGSDELDMELDTLRHWDLAPANPKALAGTKLKVAYSAFGLSTPKDLHKRLATAIGRGLTADQALAALTTIPAKLAGIEDRAGTLAVGKMANLIVVDGELFQEATAIREVWVDGERFEIKERKPAEVEPAGTWELTVDAGGQQIPATVEITGKVPSLAGTMTVMGQKMTLSSVEVSGKAVEFSFEGGGAGMPGLFTLTMNLDGDRASGTGSGPPGPFTFRGQRTSSPAADAPPQAPQEVSR